MPTEDRPAERKALEAAGLAALRSPETLEPLAIVANRQPIVRLWHDPAFFAPTSWTVFAPASPSTDGTPKALVRRVRWDRPHDLHHFLAQHFADEPQ